MQHLAIIMDGNRRWADRRKEEFAAGRDVADPSRMLNALLSSIDKCLAQGVPYLSVYALSIENLKRSDDTKSILYSMLQLKCKEIVRDLNVRGVRMQFLGDRLLFDASVTAAVSEIETGTSSNTRMLVSVLFCYGAQQEVVAASKSLALKVASGFIAASEINETSFERELWTGGLPPVDLMIRTGGFNRLSNFLFYKAAYAEFVFLDMLWPDVTEEILDDIFMTFSKTVRKFGQ